ncbi:MAG TPA: M14 family zinc carboxypeptidase [Planctomycetota bacterium]|nr:M14 family zinc carboxypeptidase [Planctomycetota bacterium]
MSRCVRHRATWTALALLAATAPARAQDPVTPPPPPASEPPAAGAPAPPESKPAPPAPPVIDYTVRFDLATYEASLGGIAAAYPDLLRVRSLGKSRGGRDIWLAVAADDSAGDAGHRPAALVVTDLAYLPKSRAPGPEAALFALATLLERARAETSVRERLQRTALYFLPAPDPDAAFAAAESDAAAPVRRCRLDRNFPAGWQPYDAESEASGPYPLSEPESRLLAHFLLERLNLSIVLAFDGTTEPAAPPRADDARPPGSFEAFCRDVLDTTVLHPAPWNGAARTSAAGSAPEGFFTAAALAERTLDELPRIECGAPKLERLRPNVWLVDLPLANTGVQPTRGRAARTGESGEVQLRATGGLVVACAMEHGGGTYDAVRAARDAWPLGHLDGRAKATVRLVVQADEGTPLEVSFDSPRSGRARVSLVLR